MNKKNQILSLSLDWLAEIPLKAHIHNITNKKSLQTIEITYNDPLPNFSHADFNNHQNYDNTKPVTKKS